MWHITKLLIRSAKLIYLGYVQTSSEQNWATHTFIYPEWIFLAETDHPSIKAKAIPAVIIRSWKSCLFSGNKNVIVVFELPWLPSGGMRWKVLMQWWSKETIVQLLWSWIERHTLKMIKMTSHVHRNCPVAQCLLTFHCAMKFAVRSLEDSSLISSIQIHGRVFTLRQYLQENGKQRRQARVPRLDSIYSM